MHPFKFFLVISCLSLLYSCNKTSSPQSDTSSLLLGDYEGDFQLVSLETVDTLGDSVLNIEVIPDALDTTTDSFEFYICSQSDESNCSPTKENPEFVEGLYLGYGYEYPLAPVGKNIVGVRACDTRENDYVCGDWEYYEYTQEAAEDEESEEIINMSYEIEQTIEDLAENIEENIDASFEDFEENAIDSLVDSILEAIEDEAGLIDFESLEEALEGDETDETDEEDMVLIASVAGGSALAATIAIVAISVDQAHRRAFKNLFSPLTNLGDGPSSLPQGFKMRTEFSDEIDSQTQTSKSFGDQKLQDHFKILASYRAADARGEPELDDESRIRSGYARKQWKLEIGEHVINKYLLEETQSYYKDLDKLLSGNKNKIKEVTSRTSYLIGLLKGRINKLEQGPKVDAQKIEALQFALTVLENRESKYIEFLEGKSPLKGSKKEGISRLAKIRKAALLVDSQKALAMGLKNEKLSATDQKKITQYIQKLNEFFTSRGNDFFVTEDFIKDFSKGLHLDSEASLELLKKLFPDTNKTIQSLKLIKKSDRNYGNLLSDEAFVRNRDSGKLFSSEKPKAVKNAVDRLRKFFLGENETQSLGKFLIKNTEQIKNISDLYYELQLLQLKKELEYLD